MWLCTGFGWFQAAKHLKLVFLEMLYVTTYLVFQNLFILIIFKHILYILLPMCSLLISSYFPKL